MELTSAGMTTSNVCVVSPVHKEQEAQLLQWQPIVRATCVRRTVYWQTIKPILVTSLRTVGTHDPIQRVYERTQTLSTQAWPL